MQLDLNKLVAIASTVFDAVTGDEDITIRHAGMVVKAPLAGNENSTIAQIAAAYGSQVGIPQGARPSFSRPGEGDLPGTTVVTPGIYDIFTDKKENASS
jgi:hypothetical protein